MFLWLVLFLTTAAWPQSGGRWGDLSYTSPSARGAFAAVTFLGKVWISGGLDASTNVLDDLWTSSDGITWDEVQRGVPWGPRYGHTITEFHGKLWLIGGIGDGELPQGVWQSANGRDWIEVQTDLPDPAPFYLHEAVVFQDKLWIIGGNNGTQGRNWVWNTSDGTNWVEVSATYPVPWSGRWNHRCVVFNGKLFLMGGTYLQNDVWCTEDGIAWTELTPAAPWATRFSHTVSVYENELWLIGGHHDGPPWPHGPLNDVWRSSDGITWTQEPPEQIPWPARSDHSAFVHDGGLWIVGPTDDCWRYEPSLGWREVELTPPPMWSPRVYHESTVFANKMWLFGGFRGYTFLNDIYWSDNGQHWNKVIPEPTMGLTQRLGQTIEAHNGYLWVLGGSGATGIGDVWKSADGVHWQSLLETAPWGPRGFHASVNFRDKLWVLGGNSYAGASATAVNDVWSSVDGLNWEHVSPSAPWSPRLEPEVVVFENKLWVFGGRIWTPYGDVWASEDGVNWTEVSASHPVPWQTLLGHRVVVYDHMLWVIGGAQDSLTTTDNKIWLSHDGYTWTNYDTYGDVPWSPRAYHQAVVYNDSIYVIGGYGSELFNDLNNEVWVFSPPFGTPLSKFGVVVMIVCILAVGVAALRARRRNYMAAHQPNR